MRIAALCVLRTVENYGRPKRSLDVLNTALMERRTVENYGLTQAPLKITAAIINAFTRIKDPTSNKGFAVLFLFLARLLAWR